MLIGKQLQCYLWLLGDITFEGLIDPDNLPQEFLEMKVPTVFFQRPTPEMVINIAPEGRREPLTFVEDKATGLFYVLSAWIPKTIARHGAYLEAATYKIKGGGYGIWPLEEYARPGYTSAKEIAENYADKWIRVHCKGKNGCKVEAVDDQEHHDWSRFDPHKGMVVYKKNGRLCPAGVSEKDIIGHHAFTLSAALFKTHPVLQPIIRKNKREKRK